MFLPLISWFWLALAGTAPSELDQQPGRDPVAVVRVVAGTGELAAGVLDRVQASADERMSALLPLFPGLKPATCFVFVHADRDHMPAELSAHLHPESPGFTILGRRQIHLVWGEMRSSGSNLRGVVAHELVHDLLDQYVAPHGHTIPRWFHEGLAQHIAGDTYLGAREEDLVWRIGMAGMFAFGEIRRHFPDDAHRLRIAYAQSYSYVDWLVKAYGLPTLLEIARSGDDLTSFERALVGRTGRTTLELEDAWRHHLLHGSGAPARAVLDQCFTFVLIGLLPVLALALIRRLAAERRAAARLANSPDFEPVAQQPPADHEPGPER